MFNSNEFSKTLHWGLLTLLSLVLVNDISFAQRADRGRDAARTARKDVKDATIARQKTTIAQRDRTIAQQARVIKLLKNEPASVEKHLLHYEQTVEALMDRIKLEHLDSEWEKIDKELQKEILVISLFQRFQM